MRSPTSPSTAACWPGCDRWHTQVGAGVVQEPRLRVVSRFAPEMAGCTQYGRFDDRLDGRQIRPASERSNALEKPGAVRACSAACPRCPERIWLDARGPHGARLRSSAQVDPGRVRPARTGSARRRERIRSEDCSQPRAPRPCASRSRPARLQGGSSRPWSARSAPGAKRAGRPAGVACPKRPRRGRGEGNLGRAVCGPGHCQY